MRKLLIATFICLWNAPACYLIHQMVHDMARGGPIEDFGREFESSKATERFFMDWLAINGLAAIGFGVVACTLPRLRRLIRGKDEAFERETVISFFGSLVLGLLGLFAMRYFQ